MHELLSRQGGRFAQGSHPDTPCQRLPPPPDHHLLAGEGGVGVRRRQGGVGGNDRQVAGPQVAPAVLRDGGGAVRAGVWADHHVPLLRAGGGAGRSGLDGNLGGGGAFQN